MFQLINLHTWQAANCTLHTAQCILRTAPEPANAPESEHVHIILHIEHCTLHTKFILHLANVSHHTAKIQNLPKLVSWWNVPWYIFQGDLSLKSNIIYLMWWAILSFSMTSGKVLTCESKCRFYSGCFGHIWHLQTNYNTWEILILRGFWEGF